MAKAKRAAAPARFSVLKLLFLILALAAAWLAWVVVVPVQLPLSDKPYQMVVGQQQGIGRVAANLARDGVVRNRLVMVALARMGGIDRRLKPGVYQVEGSTSMWQLLQRLDEGRPDQLGLTVIEGWTFRQFRQALNRRADVRHDSAALSDAELLRQLGAPEAHPEGLFFPSTYFVAPGGSDLEVFRQAYRTMQQKLERAWNGRAADLPYDNPYEMLIMASLIEKETNHPEDRAQVAAVFVNRLKIGMRLQTDPAVIYGMGQRFQGNISKGDLRRDTDYNTYRRAGLTPTPIALPGDAALEAAAHPADSRALYFVARGDGTTQFSETLDEHNAAVRRFILKRGN